MKIMIVDDEAIIRKGLCTVIDWKELGLTLLEPAECGEEALERIPVEKPHIVLTDIRMPGIDGIELAKEIKKIAPGTEIVILTGYDDFAYAQQALREGVTDYLLKTSGPEEIMKSALKAKMNITDRWEAQRKEQVQTGALRRELLEGHLAGRRESGSELALIESWMKERGVTGSAAEAVPLRALIVSASGWGEGKTAELLLGAVENMLAELLPSVSLLKSDRIVLVARAGPGFAERSGLERAVRRVCETLKCSVFVAAGDSVASSEELPRSYGEAERIYAYRLLLRGRGVCELRDIASRSGGATVCPQHEEEELAELLMGNVPTQLRHFVHRLVREQMDDPSVTPQSLRAYLQSVAIAGHRWLERARGGSPGSGGHPAQVPAHSFEDGFSLEDELFKLLASIMAAFHETMSDTRYSYVHRAIAYIRERLDRNLTLQEVAKFVHLTPNHFSDAFKKETGQSYIEFVTQERMRKAAHVLKSTPLKISEVAGAVGYEDIKYFSQQFKRYTGQTPSEYRQSSAEETT
ncbi:response regulator [Paenibacillus contaminans]|uniref:DNA-binding response regulator n=1 Tax=Paenibacillus contaminans TaxID=450362 RepID=A0A329LVP9_9BACL|nr:response regulator [Paenibacillus contaminans]RAV11764.1 DNA-binding response regulator [Paenibacillus contaminans]